MYSLLYIGVPLATPYLMIYKLNLHEILQYYEVSLNVSTVN